MKRKVLLLIVFISIIGLLGCRDDTHVHEYFVNYDDNSHWDECDCGNIVKKISHAFSTEILKPATETEEGSKKLTCECGYYKIEVIEPVVHTHTYSEKVAEVEYLKSEANCGSPALYYYSCKCGEIGTKVFSNGDALPHTYSKEWTYDDNSHWHEATCQHSNEVSNMESHNWNSGVVTLEPTEESTGLKEFLCSVCGVKKIEELPKIEHVHKFDLEVVLDKYLKALATCNNKEQYYYSCRCGEMDTKYFEVGKLADHTYSTEWSYNDTSHWHEATCNHKSEVSGLSNHTWDQGKFIVEPSSTVPGIIEYTCTECFKTKQVTHSHLFNKRNVTEEYLKSSATCDKKALYYYSCSCGIKGTQTFEYGDYASHTYSTTWIYDEEYHWHQATCSHTDEITDKNLHVWVYKGPSSPATTTNEGIDEYVCSTCNKSKFVNVGVIGHEHTYSTDWSYNDEYHWNGTLCDHDVTNNIETHEWRINVVTKPTIFEVGISEYTCNKCNYIKTVELDIIDSYKVIYYDEYNNLTSEKYYETSVTEIYVPTPIVKPGYTFVGWYDLRLDIILITPEINNPTNGDVFEYKMVYEKSYTVTFVDYEGNVIKVVKEVLENTDVKPYDIPQIPQREGYDAKWDTEELKGITEDLVVTPIYTVKTYTVTFYTPDNIIIPYIDEYGNSIETQTIEYGLFAYEPKCEEYLIKNYVLYEFSGWSGSTQNIKDNMKIYALYNKEVLKPAVVIEASNNVMKMTILMPDDLYLYSMNLSMKWNVGADKCSIEKVDIKNTTPLLSNGCNNNNCTVDENSNWVTYNNKNQTLNLIWSCGVGHKFDYTENVVTITFGLDNGVNQISEDLFEVLEISSIIYGYNFEDVSNLTKDDILVIYK